jgi:predicted regulator of Ras-like GTPase activity (Roadblock/LC7/MglB family)
MAASPPAPVAFADWSRVTEILDQAATGGITSIMLIQQDGALLASSRGTPASTVTGALITSIWGDHAAFGAGQDVQALLIDCSNGQVSVARVGAFLLCVIADNRTQPGIIRGKVRLHTLHHSSAHPCIAQYLCSLSRHFLRPYPSTFFRPVLPRPQPCQMSALLAALMDLQKLFPQQM